MKKKILALLMTLACITSVVGCENKKEDVSNKNSSEAVTNVNKVENKEPEKKEEEKKPEVSSSSVANKSDIKNPLKKGTNGNASIYFASSKKYMDVPIKLIDITRGEKAKTTVDKYNKDAVVQLDLSDKPTLEYAVASFEITIPKDYPVPKHGMYPNPTVEIKGLDGNSVKHDGVIYILSTVNTSPRSKSIQAGESMIIDIAYGVPKGCSDYVLKIGNLNQTLVYFKGE